MELPKETIERIDNALEKFHFVAPLKQLDKLLTPDGNETKQRSMNYENFESALKNIDDLIQIEQNPNRIQTMLDHKMKLVSVMPPAPYTLKRSWVMERGKSIEMNRIITMNPFDQIDLMSSISKSTNDSLRCLDLLKDVMQEFIYGVSNK